MRHGRRTIASRQARRRVWRRHAGKRAAAKPSAAAEPAPAAESPTGRRRSKQPLVVVSKAEHRDDALAGLERWKSRHPDAASRLHEDDVLIDAMRGRSTTWTRIRVNLRHVPDALRPPDEPPDPDYDPWRRVRKGGDVGDVGDVGEGAAAPRARKRAPKTRSSS
jgi:hypothetical protein